MKGKGTEGKERKERKGNMGGKGREIEGEKEGKRVREATKA